LPALRSSHATRTAGLCACGSRLLNKQVAARLGTSERTVKVHRARVMRNLGSIVR
jgi:FixJ family two-component response regulator